MHEPDTYNFYELHTDQNVCITHTKKHKNPPEKDWVQKRQKEKKKKKI